MGGGVTQRHRPLHELFPLKIGFPSGSKQTENPLILPFHASFPPAECPPVSADCGQSRDGGGGGGTSLVPGRPVKWG